MKVTNLLMASFLVLQVLSCRQSSTQDQEGKMGTVSPRVAAFLGSGILDIIKNPDRVESYKVKFTKTNRGDNQGGYPVMAKGPNLTQKQKERLQAILFDEDTYLFDVVKKCLFLPEFAFRFVKGDGHVVVLICYSCEELTFVFNGKELLEDFNHATPRLKMLTGELF